MIRIDSIVINKLPPQLPPINKQIQLQAPNFCKHNEGCAPVLKLLPLPNNILVLKPQTAIARQ